MKIGRARQRVDHQYRSVAVADRALRTGAAKDIEQRLLAMRTEHQQVGLVFAGGTHDALVGDAEHDTKCAVDTVEIDDGGALFVEQRGGGLVLGVDQAPGRLSGSTAGRERDGGEDEGREDAAQERHDSHRPAVTPPRRTAAPGRTP